MLRRFALAAAALAAAAPFATPAAAQDVPQVLSPLTVETDHNGVNLVSGKTKIDVPVLTAPGAGNLRFDRVQDAAPYVLSTYGSGDVDAAQSSHSIHHGGPASESFKCTGSGCESVTGSGSTFNEGRYYRQSGSGALMHFSRKHFDTRNTGSTSPKSQYYASWIEYPNGEKISYSYGTAIVNNLTYYRPVTLSSNLGYSISISYWSDAFGTNEWNSVKEAALYGPGSSAPIQKFSYSAGGGTSITDLAGRVYNCTSCTNQLGSPMETWAGSFQLPGEGAPALQANRHPTEEIVASVTKDGVPWTYSYAGLSRVALTNGYVYDTVTIDGPNGFHVVYDMSQVGPLGSPRNVITKIIAKINDSTSRPTTIGVDSFYRPTSMTLQEGNSIAVTYDGWGNIISKTTSPKPNSGLNAITETAHYPSEDLNLCTLTGADPRCYRPIWSRDGFNRQTDFVYNARGQLIEQTDPADQNGVRRKTYVTYDASSGVSRRTAVRTCGLGTTCGTANEIRTEYEYWGSTLLPSVERKIDSARERP